MWGAVVPTLEIERRTGLHQTVDCRHRPTGEHVGDVVGLLVGVGDHRAVVVDRAPEVVAGGAADRLPVVVAGRDRALRYGVDVLADVGGAVSRTLEPHRQGVGVVQPVVAAERGLTV